MRQWCAQYGKPVIDDEYEGNVKRNWGNITAREFFHRFWISVCYSGYAGHGETYEHPEDVLWWSKGGVLHGQSAPRLPFCVALSKKGRGALSRCPAIFPGIARRLADAVTTG